MTTNENPATTALRMNQVVKLIRKNGTADLILNGEQVTVGFESARTDTVAGLIMLGGGYYVATTSTGRKYDIAKGQLIDVVNP